jgi:hypothetical protein
MYLGLRKRSRDKALANRSDSQANASGVEIRKGTGEIGLNWV